MIRIIFCFAFCFISISAYSQTIVIKGGEIHTGLNEEPFVGDILIDGDTILEVSTKSLKGDVVVDASNKIVTPGVIAPDTQIGILEIGAISETRDGDSDIYSMGFSVYDAINPNSTLIPWNRSNGVTSAITLPDFNWDPLSGMASYLLLDGSLRVNGMPDVALTGEIGAISLWRLSRLLVLHLAYHLPSDCHQEADMMPFRLKDPN